MQTRLLRLVMSIVILTFLPISGMCADKKLNTLSNPTLNIKNYIDDYLKGHTWHIMMEYDAIMARTISDRAHNAPQSLQVDEEEKALAEMIQYWKTNEKDKMENGTQLENVIGMLGGSGSIPFFKVLYPKMSYKILEVRDKKANGPDQFANYNKEAFVKLTYADPDNAPGDKGRKLKKAVVRVLLEKWSKDYKVQGYIATNYGREYF